MTTESDAARLTTHVLDVSRGAPAAGVAITLARLDGPDAGPVGRARTNHDGRTDDPLLAGAELTPGRYELVFAIGAYFAAAGGSETAHGTGLDAAGPPYLDEVPIRFGVAPGTVHLHVALLVTPWSYTTYRGS